MEENKKLDKMRTVLEEWSATGVQGNREGRKEEGNCLGRKWKGKMVHARAVTAGVQTRKGRAVFQKERQRPGR